jgi:DNA processing protein
VTALPQPAYAAALAALPLMTVQRLRALLCEQTPEAAYAVAAGLAPPSPLLERALARSQVRQAWCQAATADHAEQVWQRCQQLGLHVLVSGHGDYPHLLACDHTAPAVLFAKGDLRLLAGRRAAIIGTRNATANGRFVAGRFGQELAANGVHVVSGLARGVDGCAHRGALRAVDGAAPVGVVGSGLDIVYPREHAALWAEVAERGLLLSEAPPGALPEAYRFPLRNRLLAALAEVVVVVESRERGGSLITVNEAIGRDVPVMAVPGSPASRASAGTNALLRDGATPATEPADVLDVLRLDHRRQWVPDPELRPRPSGLDARVYGFCAREPQSVESLAEKCSASLVEVAMAVARLEQHGWLLGADGWYQTLGARFDAR